MEFFSRGVCDSYFVRVNTTSATATPPDNFDEVSRQLFRSKSHPSPKP